MKEGAVLGGGLDGVSDGVSEIEEGAGARDFPFVLFHDAGLDGEVVGNEARVDLSVTRIHALNFFQHPGIPDGSVFDYLREALVKDLVRKRDEDVRVHENEAGLLERSDQVLSLGNVHSRLPPDRAVDLGHDGGGNLHKGNAPVEDGGHEACHITDDPAAEGHDKAASVMVMLNKGAAEGLGLLHGLGAFPGGDEVGADLEVGLLKGGLHRLAVMKGNVSVRDEGHSSGEPGLLD